MSYSRSPLEDLREYLTTLKTDLEGFAYNPDLAEYVQPIIYSLTVSIQQIDEQINGSWGFRKNH